MNKKRSAFIVKDGKGNVELYYLVDLKTDKDIVNLNTSDYSFEDGIDVNVFDLYEQNRILQHQLEEKNKIIDKAIKYLIKIGKQPDADLYYCISEHEEYKELLEILESGKNGK